MNMCLSGGAEGADIAWGIAAENAGHTVVHWSFKGHRSNATNVCVLDDTHLKVADMYLELANKSISRKWPTSSNFINNLLRRNFYQIYYSDCVYAVSKFTNDGSLLKIEGGTSWACQMYIDRWLHTDRNIKESRLYFFDQVLEKWFTWSGTWTEITQPPVPTGVYAGIGSRNLNNAGLKAICDVYG